MPQSPREPEHQTRVPNPFALPPETNVRFTLLMVAAVMLMISIADYMLISWGVHGEDLPGLAQIDPSGDADQTFAMLRDLLRAQTAPILLVLGLLAAVVIVLLATALFLYLIHPAIIRARQKLYPVPPDADRFFTRTIELHAHYAELPRAPRIEMSESAGALTDGQAFGLPGQYVIRLGRRMPLLLRKAPDLFNAIVLHELAHIVNGDIGRAYYARALVRVASIIAVIGYFIGMLGFVITTFRGGMGGVAALLLSQIILIVQLAASLAILALLYRSILRVREVYADWRAALWGSRDGLAQVLKNNLAKEAPLKGRLAQTLRFHPSSEERREALKDPNTLFALSGGIPFYTGLLLSITFACMNYPFAAVGILEIRLFIEFYSLYSVYASQNPTILLILIGMLSLVTMLAVVLLPLALMGVLVGGTLGLQIQREGLGELVSGHASGWRGYGRLLGTAALFVIGMQLGFLIAPSPFAQFNPFVAFPPQALIRYVQWVGEVLLWMVGVWIAMWVWMVFVRAASRSVLGRHRGASIPRLKRVLLSFPFTLLLALVIVPAYVWQLALKGRFWVTGSITPTSWVLTLWGIMVVLYIVVALAAITLHGMARLSTGTCPVCGQRTRHIVAVGHDCEHCGEPLAAWMTICAPGFEKTTLGISDERKSVMETVIGRRAG
jgi:Zn-dependent protease with chaperone function